MGLANTRKYKRKTTPTKSVSQFVQANFVSRLLIVEQELNVPLMSGALFVFTNAETVRANAYVFYIGIEQA